MIRLLRLWLKHLLSRRHGCPRQQQHSQQHGDSRGQQRRLHVVEACVVLLSRPLGVERGSVAW